MSAILSGEPRQATAHFYKSPESTPVKLLNEEQQSTKLGKKHLFSATSIRMFDPLPLNSGHGQSISPKQPYTKAKNSSGKDRERGG